jgi:LysM repeat protein
VIDTWLHLCHFEVTSNLSAGSEAVTGKFMKKSANNTQRQAAQTNRTAHDSTANDRSKLGKSLFATLPLVLVGSLAMSMNLTGPIETAAAKRPVKDKTAAPTELGKSVRQAMAQAKAELAAAPTADLTPTGQLSVAATPTTYTVAAGDTISSIAGRYGLSTASVLALNGLGWKSLIHPGQRLILAKGAAPVASTPTVAPQTSAARYTIVKGDTIGKIAGKYGVTTQALLTANGLKWSSIIYPGQTLAVPGSSAPANVAPAAVIAPPAAQSPAVQSHATKAPVVAAPATHVIASGDTISGIAARYGVTAQALLTANGLGWSSIIYSGRSLVIPGAASTAPASSTTVTPLTAEMAANAAIIVSVGKSLGVNDYGLVIALATAMQESTLRNLNWGDLDSRGLFQQRPSTGWGTPAQVTDPAHASRLFFGGPSNPNKGVTRGLLDIPGWQGMTVTQAAQAVQISAYPDAYAKWETSARSWLAQLR